jgi:uncharacterized protein YjiS (DUF1127 family)
MLMNSVNKQNNTLVFVSPRSLGSTNSLWEWLHIISWWMERSHQRRDLAKLDDRLLDDIGITRSAAAGEIAKPFWR